MIFRPITLRKTDDTVIEFLPECIQRISFKEENVILDYWEEPVAIQTTRFILKKEDYYYYHWRSFINQLTRMFDIKEINYE